MIRRDYLLTQIQELGRFLRRLIEMLTGKSAGSAELVDPEVQKTEFRDKCGFDMDLLWSPDFEELRIALLGNSGYNGENLELLADFMVLWGDSKRDIPVTQSIRIKFNALKIYELIETTEKTWSMERNQKMAELRMSLD